MKKINTVSYLAKRVSYHMIQVPPLYSSKVVGTGVQGQGQDIF